MQVLVEEGTGVVRAVDIPYPAQALLILSRYSRARKWEHKYYELLKPVALDPYVRYRYLTTRVDSDVNPPEL